MKKSTKKFWKNTISMIAIAVMFVSTMAGFMAIFVGPSSSFLLKSPYSLFMYFDAYKVDYNIREIALNMSKGCKGNQDCVVIQIYKNLSETLIYSNTPYDSYMNKYEVLREKSADCKSMSGLYVNLLINMGIVAYVDSNIRYKHAVAIAEPRGADYYYMIDLTVPEIQRFDKGQDHWKLRFENHQGLI